MAVRVRPPANVNSIDVVLAPILIVLAEIVALLLSPTLLGLAVRGPSLREFFFSIAVPLIIVTLASFLLAKYLILLQYYSGGPPPPPPGPGTAALISLFGSIFFTAVTVQLFPPNSIYDVLEALGTYAGLIHLIQAVYVSTR